MSLRWVDQPRNQSSGVQVLVRGDLNAPQKYENNFRSVEQINFHMCNRNFTLINKRDTSTFSGNSTHAPDLTL